MNFYSIKKRMPSNWYGSPGCRNMQCCASAEAYINGTSGSASRRVQEILDNAMWGNKTFLNWYIVPELPNQKECEEVIKNLPATIPLGSYKNLNTGRLVNAYLTNLQQEWTNEESASQTGG